MINAKDTATPLINPGECLARILRRKMQKRTTKKGNKDMWKLTITQKRTSEYMEGTINETVEFFHKNISVLTNLICTLQTCENGIETTYKLERVGDE